MITNDSIALTRDRQWFSLTASNWWGTLQQPLMNTREHCSNYVPETQQKSQQQNCIIFTSQQQRQYCPHSGQAMIINDSYICIMRKKGGSASSPHVHSLLLCQCVHACTIVNIHSPPFSTINILACNITRGCKQTYWLSFSEWYKYV